MQRITEKQLHAIVDRINQATNSPALPYSMVDGKHVSNVGNYHLYFAYGGVQLNRMVNQGGGVTNPLGGGFDTKRGLANRMWAFLAGIEAANQH